VNIPKRKRVKDYTDSRVQIKNIKSRLLKSKYRKENFPNTTKSMRKILANKEAMRKIDQKN